MLSTNALAGVYREDFDEGKLSIEDYVDVVKTSSPTVGSVLKESLRRLHLPETNCDYSGIFGYYSPLENCYRHVTESWLHKEVT